jgi:ubiquitin-protein ligase
MSGISKLQSEHKFIKRSGILATHGGTAAPIKKNYLHWFGNIEGPKNSPYEKGTFYFEMKFKNTYPEPGCIEDVQMRTPIVHPNISCSNGHICVSYISGWTNKNTIAGIVNSIFELLKNPSTTVDTSKAKNYTSLYASTIQNINWDSSWNKGWTIS